MKIKILRIILISLLFITFLQIFGFSSQTGEKSSGVSRKVTVAVTNNVEKIQKLEYSEKEKVLDKVEHVIRKLAHFSIYTLVGVLMMALMSTYDIPERNRIIISILVGFIYASSDEFHQLFVDGRSAMFTDVLIDTAGTFLGILIVKICILGVSKIGKTGKQKKRQKILKTNK